MPPKSSPVKINKNIVFDEPYDLNSMRALTPAQVRKYHEIVDEYFKNKK
jgi:hypothetical protein